MLLDGIAPELLTRRRHLVYLPDFVNKCCSGCVGGGWCNHYTSRRSTRGKK
jgi:hypothetical protein